MKASYRISWIESYETHIYSAETLTASVLNSMKRELGNSAKQVLKKNLFSVKTQVSNREANKAQPPRHGQRTSSLSIPQTYRNAHSQAPPQARRPKNLHLNRPHGWYICTQKVEKASKVEGNVWALIRDQNHCSSNILVIKLRTSHANPLNLSFIICKAGIIKAPQALGKQHNDDSNKDDNG